MKQLENKLNSAVTLDDATNVLLKWYEGSDVVFFRTFVEKLPEFVLNTFVESGYITDAASDNLIYGRQNGEWVDVTESGMDVDVYDPLSIKEQLVGQSAPQELVNKTLIDLSNSIFANRVRTKALASTTDVNIMSPVRIVGYDELTSTNIGEVINNALYTAYGIAAESTTIGEPFEVIHQGILSNVDTSIFIEGDVLYVSSIGDLTSVIPITGKVQPIAYVIRSHETLGEILVNAFYNIPIASQIEYDNTLSGLSGVSVQEALDEIASSYIQSVVPGDNVTVDNTDPYNPVISSTGGGGGSAPTNLAYTPSPTDGVVTSDTGTDATITLVDDTNAGLMSSAQSIKLDTIAEGATVYTNEMAQDTVASILVNSSDIDFTYLDNTPSIAATLSIAVQSDLSLAQSALQSGEIEVSDFLTGVIDTDISTVSTLDDTIPTSKATKTALDLKQNTLVSGTNIKTINSASLLGSGDITISSTPAGATTNVQFNSAGAFGADTLFAWDNTNKCLGVGIAAPLHRLHVKGTGATAATFGLKIENSAGANMMSLTDTVAGSILQLSSNDVKIQGQVGNYVYLQTNGLQGFGTEFSVSNSLNEFKFKHSTSYSFTLGKYVSGANGAAWFGWSTTPPAVNLSAQVQIDSTTKGFLPPRMTTTQKNAITTPAAGLVVYDTTLNKLCVFTTAWETITSL